MAIALTVPALALLLSFPGISGLPHLPGLGAFKHRTVVVPPDTLPPAWKSASRLALEDQLVLAQLRPLGPPGTALIVQPYNDPRKLNFSFDSDSSEVVAVPEWDDIPLDIAKRVSVAAYARELTLLNYQKLWKDKSKTSINSLGSNVSSYVPKSGLSFSLPSPLPPRIQSMLGPGGPALNVSGSENIVLSGTSSWTNQQIGLLGQRRSLFPTLDMQQNLDIRLEGQLSDRIKVNLLQNSLNQIPLQNKIAINYRGEEDDLVQEFDLGNTNLSLPGTQYVSYSGQNEGLFGLKAASRVGPLDFTVLASKQEGSSERATYAGGSQKLPGTILDTDYIRDTYFFLYDPNREATMLIADSTLKVYVDNAVISNDANRIRGRAFINPNGSDTTSVRGSFKQLIAGADKDYELLRYYGPNFPILRLRQPLSSHSNQTLAVTYKARIVSSGQDVVVGGQDIQDSDGTVERTLKLIRAPDVLLATETNSAVGGSIFYADTGAFNVTRDLELKNLYALGGQRIDPKSFTLTVRQGTGQPYKTALQVADSSVSYLETIGLDSYDESGGVPVFGRHDSKVDGTAAGGGSQLLAPVDFENGILFLPDPRPFAPRLDPVLYPFDAAVNKLISRRITLIGTPTDSNAANAKIYRKFQNEEGRDAVYYMDDELTAASVGNDIQLGRGNILAGSVVVTVNNERWVQDRDYTVDYDIGRVTLKRAVGPSDQLNIGYSYAPTFQQAGRTLLGSAFRLEGREKSAAGAFLYESRGAQDLRPRLGEEPSRSLIGDLNGDWTAHPTWITHLVDRLPGVRTTTPSDLHVQAEVGASFPNPNTRNEVFIDDMEGVRDAVSLSMGPERWHWSSVPSRQVSGFPQLVNNLDHMHNAEIHWYSPPSVVHEKDLKPTLTQAQGGDNPRQVLGISVPRRPLTARNNFAGGDFDTLWAGLTYQLDPVGLDLSKSQFIELWVNDFNDQHDVRHPEPRVRGRHVKLHIDLGRVSEDMQRAPDELPDNVLNTEDQNHDGQLQVSGDLFEDTGYDGKVDPATPAHPGDVIEPGTIRDLTTASADDPEGDTFHGTDANYSDIDPRRYRFTNGTEGNKNINPNPDTEDLNLNGNLDTNESFFEYTIDLGDTSASYPYLAKGGDLQKEKLNGAPGFSGVASDNGWRRYRIPISDSLRVAFGNNPNLVFTQHVRVWMEGIINPDPDPDSLGGTDTKNYPVRPLVMLGALDIVGSRWQIQPLDSNTVARGTTVTLNSVNSVDNSNIYTPPFDPGQTLNGNQSVTRREQSLALEFTNLAPSDTLEVFKTFSLDEDYTRYGKLNWYAANYQIPGYTPGVDSLFYFVRFSSDENELNYYEYRAPMPATSGDRDIHWDQVLLELKSLSNLKLNRDFPRVEPILYFAPGDRPGVTYVVSGRPSFTRLRRIAIGIINSSTTSSRVYPSGQLWFDELRATDVAKDVGRAERIDVSGRMANLLGYNFSYSGRDADFLSVGENRGQGFNTNQINFGGNFDLHRFFEGTGIVVPLGFAYSSSSLRPRYSAGDDVVRTDQQAAASETRTESKTYSAAISRQWSARSNPFLRFTLGGLAANISRTVAVSRTPTSVDTSTSTGAAVGYGISPRSLFSFGLPGTKARFFPLPEKLFWNYSIATRESHTYDRLADSTGSLVLRNAIKGRSAFIAFGGDTRPFELLHHHFEGTRNLTLGDMNEHWGFFNLGRVVNWRQSLDAHYTMTRGDWLRPVFGWGSSYIQNNGPELSPDLSIRSVANNQSATMSWSLPFDRLAAQPFRPADSTHARRRSSVVSQFLSRLGEVGTEASYNQNSAYSRLTGTPGFGYLFGFSRNPGLNTDTTGRVRPSFGNIASDENDWRTAAHARLSTGFGSAINTRGEYTARRTNSNGVVQFTIASRFPDFDVDYGKVASVIQLDRVIKDAHLHTGYNRSTTSDFQGEGDSQTGRASSDAWSPLLGLDGSLKNGTRAEVKLGLRSSTREDFVLGHSITEDHNTEFSLNLSRTYSQGQKVNFLGKESTIRSTVTLGLAASYTRRTGETRRSDDPKPEFPIGEDRLDVNGNGSYGFSNNVTGHALIGFGQNRDLLRDIVRRNIRVELRGQFTF
jgi:hypothetical protein